MQCYFFDKCDYLNFKIIMASHCSIVFLLQIRMSQMVMTNEDARRSLEELKKENNVVQEDVKKVCMKLKLLEMFLQKSADLFFCICSDLHHEIY